MTKKLVHITVVRSVWIDMPDDNDDIDQTIMESEYYDEKLSKHECITGWYDPESGDSNEWM